ncbi:MAG TPA: glycosyltransferase family 2 protein [Candidatus Paceibacterota bacterium]
MYRLFERLPGFLAWGTLLLMIFASWQKPLWAAIFIILFDTYWLLKTIYLTFHLRATFVKMRANLKINWQERLEKECSGRWESLRHLVILPMYHEPYSVVKESLESLTRTNYPPKKIIVVLATEERAGEEAQKTAIRLEQEYAAQFGSFLITRHPVDIAGEIPGKGSNETWAAKAVKQAIIDTQKIPYDQILVSVFDVDTQVYSDYFGILSYQFLQAAKPLRSSFQPIPLFINNIYDTPAFARVVSFSASFWQMMQQSRPERLTTFSSHAMPFSALVEIGYWQTDIVSEDSRIFWQCYLHYNGDWKVEPLFYPVSMDANAAPTFWQTLKNVYKQQRRWGYGVENIPYLLEGFRTNQLISGKKKAYWSFISVEGFHSWSTNVILIFALSWLPILIGSGNFGTTVLAYKLPEIAGWLIRLSNVGIISAAILSLILLPPHPKGLRKRDYVFYVAQWLLMPLTLIIFGALPALEAQTRLMLGGKWRLGFWVTPKSRNYSK